MREILEAYPGAQQALFQRYHIGVAADARAERKRAGHDKAWSLAELHTYIRNNQDLIPNGERFPPRRKDQLGLRGVDGDQLVSKRFVKKQQMQWTPRGAYLLLQIHTKTLNDNRSRRFGNSTRIDLQFRYRPKRVFRLRAAMPSLFCWLHLRTGSVRISQGNRRSSGAR